MTTGILEHLGNLLKLNGHHGIGWNEVSQDGSVIARAESAADETSATVEWVANTLQVQSLGTDGSLTLEGILVGDELVLGVKSGLRLGVNGIKERLEGLEPAVGQELGRAGVFVELSAQL